MTSELPYKPFDCTLDFLKRSGRIHKAPVLCANVKYLSTKTSLVYQSIDNVQVELI